ncbi:MAG: beta-aspartyl-peptidase (threonine type) [Chlamydiales bacterium]|jgi:beta-aspartyl-peptidase (threonine type)
MYVSSRRKKLSPLIFIIPLLILISMVTFYFFSDPTVTKKEYALAIHGGAGTVPLNLSEKNKQEYLSTLDQALQIGEEILQNGGTAVDAVEKVVVFLEDDPKFNAGKGASFNSQGIHELDASIMDGSNLKNGAVIATRTVKNPIVLSRLIMERSNHTLFYSEGAELLADDWGVDRVSEEYFYSELRYDQWKDAKKTETVQSDHSVNADGKFGTVGCVALDKHGNLAAATSTGGLTNKKSGRVGDSPIIGAGTYADNKTCAVSCTGNGEEFIRHVAAFQVSSIMEYTGVSLEVAVQRVIGEKMKPGTGGAIAISRDGEVVMSFNTNGMFRGATDSTGWRELGIWR